MELVVMALILAAVVTAQYLAYNYLGLKNLRYDLTISRDEAFEDEEIEIIEEIENAKALPLPWIRTEINCSRWLSFRGQAATAANGEQKGLVSSVFVLKGYQRCRRVWRVKCEKRGVFTIEDVSVVASDLLGLVKPAMVFRLKRGIRVLPSPADMSQGELSREAFIGDISVSRFILPDPFVISGAKEYTGREPMNRIHWAQTARCGVPMVYNNGFTTERRVLVILNMQRHFLSRTQRLSVPVMEAQIKAAAFMLDQCYQSRTAIALTANCEEPLFIGAGEGYEHTIEALRVLAELKNSCGSHIDDFFEEQDFSEYTDIVFITGFLSEKTSETLTALTAAGKCCLIFSTDIGEETPFEVCHIPRGRYYPPESGDE